MGWGRDVEMGPAPRGGLKRAGSGGGGQGRGKVSLYQMKVFFKTLFSNVNLYLYIDMQKIP